MLNGVIFQSKNAHEIGPNQNWTHEHQVKNSNVVTVLTVSHLQSCLVKPILYLARVFERQVGRSGCWVRTGTRDISPLQKGETLYGAHVPYNSAGIGVTFRE